MIGLRGHLLTLYSLPRHERHRGPLLKTTAGIVSIFIALDSIILASTALSSLNPPIGESVIGRCHTPRRFRRLAFPSERLAFGRDGLPAAHPR